MSENSTSAPSSGFSRPSRVIAIKRQAITALIVTARSIRSPLRCPRYSNLAARLQHPVQSSMRQPQAIPLQHLFRLPARLTPTLVNKNHSNGRTPSGALSSRTWTRFRRTGPPL